MRRLIAKIINKLISLLIFCILLVVIYKVVTSGIDSAYKAMYPIKYSEYVTKYSEEYNVDSYLIYAIIRTESGFKEDAQSNKDAFGLMQIIPTTGEEVAKKLKMKDYTQEDLINPETNIKIGTWYIKYLIGKFDGDLDLAIAAYNAGMGKVREWLGNPEYSPEGKLVNIPFPETENYLKKVTKSYNMYKKIYNQNNDEQ